MKLTEDDRAFLEHALNKLDWFTKLAAANPRFGSQGGRLKTDGLDPSVNIHLSNTVLAFLVEAGRRALQEGGGDGE